MLRRREWPTDGPCKYRSQRTRPEAENAVQVFKYGSRELRDCRLRRIAHPRLRRDGANRVLVVASSRNGHRVIGAMSRVERGVR